MSIQKIVITGGAGFIGTSLIAKLIGQYPKTQIVVYDNLRRNALAKTPYANHPNVKIIVGDVLDATALDAAIDGADWVVHMASIAGVDTVIKHPVLTMEISLLGTINALRSSKNTKAKRFIDFSTSEVFGSYAFRVREADVTSLGAVGEARWTYAVSKLATEHLAHNYYKQYGLPTCAIRPFNIYGPGQVGEGAIHNFVVRALKNEPITIHNQGDQIRSWCFIDDIVDAIMQCLTSGKAVGESFNIGNPRSTITIYQLAQLIVRLSGSTSPIQFVEWNFPDVELRVPDVSKADKLLGFRAKVDLEEGIMKTLEWYKHKG